MSFSETLWSFKTKNFKVTWSIEDEELDTKHMEPALAKKCQRKVSDGTWRCFESKIEVTHIPTNVVMGESYLGGSIYEDPSKFRDHFFMTKKGHGSYFRDMVTSALAEARKTFFNIQMSMDATRLRPQVPEVQANSYRS